MALLLLKRLLVSVDLTKRLGQMGQGDGFGELYGGYFGTDRVVVGTTV